MYLLDTNVISELRKTAKQRGDANVQKWVAQTPPEHFYTSALCLLELERGALLLARRDAAQGKQIKHWIAHQVRPAFAGRILAVDDEVVQRCAPMHVPHPKSEIDALIAATALCHGLAVVTRNSQDFENLGVVVLNPWLA
jgi:toxin FitB